MCHAQEETRDYTHHNSLIRFGLWPACDNKQNPQHARYPPMIRLSQTRRAMIWAVLALIAALLCFVGFRGYLSAEMLFNFANFFYC